MNRTASSTLMTEGSIWKKIVTFAFPLFLGNLFQQLYNMVDTMTALGLVKKGTRGAVSLTEYGSRTAKRYQRYYHSAAALLRQGFPELPEPQTMICQLLAQVPEESLAGLCDHQTVEEAAS